MNKYIFLIFLLVSHAVYSDEVKPDVLIKETIRLLTAGNASAAFDYAIKANKFFDDVKGIGETKKEFENFVTGIGVPASCQKLASKTLAKRYRKDLYLCLSEKQPFEILFTFYRQKDSWRLQAFSYSNNIDEYVEKLVVDEIAGAK